jgi:hypothetical protein
MKRNLHPTEEQVFLAGLMGLGLRARRQVALHMSTDGGKPRHIRKLLALSGRQFRKATRRRYDD